MEVDKNTNELKGVRDAVCEILCSTDRPTEGWYIELIEKLNSQRDRGIITKEELHIIKGIMLFFLTYPSGEYYAECIKTILLEGMGDKVVIASLDISKLTSIDVMKKLSEICWYLGIEISISCSNSSTGFTHKLILTKPREREG